MRFVDSKIVHDFKIAALKFFEIYKYNRVPKAL